MCRRSSTSGASARIPGEVSAAVREAGTEIIFVRAFGRVDRRRLRQSAPSRRRWAARLLSSMRCPHSVPCPLEERTSGGSTSSVSGSQKAPDGAAWLADGVRTRARAREGEAVAELLLRLATQQEGAGRARRGVHARGDDHPEPRRGALSVLLEQGLEAAFQRHVRLGRATRTSIKAMGLELFSPDNNTATRSPSRILDEENTRVDPRQGRVEAECGDGVTADDLAHRQDRERTRDGSRANARTRWPAAARRGTRSAPIAPVSTVTRTFI